MPMNRAEFLRLLAWAGISPVLSDLVPLTGTPHSSPLQSAPALDRLDGAVEGG